MMMYILQCIIYIEKVQFVDNIYTYGPIFYMKVLHMSIRSRYNWAILTLFKNNGMQEKVNCADRVGNDVMKSYLNCQVEFDIFV